MIDHIKHGSGQKTTFQDDRKMGRKGYHRSGLLTRSRNGQQASIHIGMNAARDEFSAMHD
jgi:hypothetical protein